MKPLTCLNVTQFLGAFNDNLFKFGLAFFLIDLEGFDQSNQILSLSSAIFVLPFILFGAQAGQLADTFSKSRLIILTKFLELLVVALAFISISFHLKWVSFFLLFMLALQSTLFGPAKYGIIPELVEHGMISKANGIITSSTFLAVITGTGYASLILDVTGHNYTILMLNTLVIALLGIVASLMIPYKKPKEKEGHIDALFIKAAARSLKEMALKPPLLLVAVASAYLLFIASYIQLNMIPFAHEILGLKALDGGYLIFLTSIGIAGGAYTIGCLSRGKVLINYVPMACFLLGLCLIALDQFSSTLWMVMLLLPITGFLGGFYQVPLDAFIQVYAPVSRRGAYIGTASLLGFIGVLVASALLYLFREAGLKSDQGFSLMGLATCFFSLLLWRELKNSFIY